MYLLDTNVVSELRKGARANAGVVEFFATLRSEEMYLSVQTIGEIRRGLESIRYRGDTAQAARLDDWLDQLVTQHAHRILAFDLECTQLWGKLMSPNPQHPIDKQIAAIALIYDLTIVTRNTDDFKTTGAHLLNPFR